MNPIRIALNVVQNRLGRVPRPSWCTYIVSFRCNARCPMCDSWRMRPGDELTVEQVETVFGKIGRLDVVRLSGGEPFLRPEFYDIAEVVQRVSNPFVMHITTNGSFPDRIEEFVRRYSLPQRLRFMVSFDGLEEEHNKSRGKEVLFSTAVESVRLLTKLRETYGVEVSVNHTVISPQSMADNEGLRALMGSMDVDVHSVLAYADSSMYTVKLRGKRADHMIVPTGYPLHPMLEGADAIGFVRDELSRVGEMSSRFVRFGKQYYLRGLLERLEGVDNPEPKPRCVELRSHIRLLPDGSVPVCQFNTEKVGNLLEQSWEEVWFGDDTIESRKWVDDCPGCWAECEVMPNAIYTGDILRA